MSKNKNGVSRRRVVTLASAAITGAMVPSWVINHAAAEGLGCLARTQVADGFAIVNLSPEFAEIASKLEERWLAWTQASERYERLDEAFRALWHSRDEAEVDRYCAHPDVMAYRKANGLLWSSLRKAMTPNVKTLDDCDFQEHCERLFAEFAGRATYEDLDRIEGRMWRRSRAVIRAGDNKEERRRVIEAYISGQDRLCDGGNGHDAHRQQWG